LIIRARKARAFNTVSASEAVILSAAKNLNSRKGILHEAHLEVGCIQAEKLRVTLKRSASGRAYHQVVSNHGRPFRFTALWG
jgi:hypothetical protein